MRLCARVCVGPCVCFCVRACVRVCVRAVGVRVRGTHGYYRGTLGNARLVLAGYQGVLGGYSSGVLIRQSSGTQGALTQGVPHGLVMATLGALRHVCVRACACRCLRVRACTSFGGCMPKHTTGRCTALHGIALGAPAPHEGLSAGTHAGQSVERSISAQ
jgi:hypothetical protein